MSKNFIDILTIGGKTNSLGETDRVISQVLADKTQLDQLYSCVFSDDAWVRMRAMDAIEKICRQHPDWITPYIDRFQTELASTTQPSIQWHLAQIYSQVKLSNQQKINAIEWLQVLLSNIEVDWIVSANAMKTLVQFTQDGFVDKNTTISLLKLQKKHASKSVVRKAEKLLQEISS